MNFEDGKALLRQVRQGMGLSNAQRAWKELNKEKRTVDVPEKRISVPASWKKDKYVKQEGKCAGCGEPFPIYHLEVDEILPLAQGGRRTKNNIQLLCGRKGNNCNQKKSSKHPVQMSKENGITILEQIS